jgi:hypothetical protein
MTYTVVDQTLGPMWKGYQTMLRETAATQQLYVVREQYGLLEITFEVGSGYRFKFRSEEHYTMFLLKWVT